MKYTLNLIFLFFRYLQYLWIRKSLPNKSIMLLGPIDNNNGLAIEPRLVGDYSDYMTYDNSLWGDNNWKMNNDYQTPEKMMAWLDRNTLYTYKRDNLGMPIEIVGRIQTGNPNINYHTNTYGTLKITQPNGAWQYKSVKPIFNKILVLNIGWLLDDIDQETALFMFSVRLK